MPAPRPARSDPSRPPRLGRPDLQRLHGPPHLPPRRGLIAVWGPRAALPGAVLAHARLSARAPVLPGAFPWNALRRSVVPWRHRLRCRLAVLIEICVNEAVRTPSSVIAITRDRWPSI